MRNAKWDQEVFACVTLLSEKQVFDNIKYFAVHDFLHVWSSMSGKQGITFFILR